MKLKELKDKLLEAGCNPNNFAICSKGDDAYCLDKKGSKWTIFYTERGCNSKPNFESENEEEACEYFFALVTKQQHWHIVGCFNCEQDAINLGKELFSIGVKPIRNDAPPVRNGEGPVYRIFVAGKDIFTVREHKVDNT